VRGREGGRERERERESARERERESERVCVYYRSRGGAGCDDVAQSSAAVHGRWTSGAGTVSVCVEVWEKTLCFMCMYLCVWVLLLLFIVLDVCAEVCEDTLYLYARTHARTRAGTCQHARNTDNDACCN
jgi:hypothetical protein